MKRKPIVGWLLLFPALFWIVGVVLFPFFSAIRLSFTKSAYGLGELTWVGLSNYIRLITDSTFWRASLVSLGWLFGNLILQLTLPMILALILNKELKGRDLARTLILTPWIIPTIVCTIIWRWLLEPTVGVINDILVVFLGSEPVVFLGSLKLALVSVIGINTWKFSPLGTVLLLAAMQTIPGEYYEAAHVDGSTAWQEFKFITFPLVGKVIWFLALLASIWIFNIVDLIWLLTEGGPGDATQTLPVLIYRSAFKLFNMGSASAMAVIVATFLTILAILYFRIFRPQEDF